MMTDHEAVAREIEVKIVRIELGNAIAELMVQRSLDRIAASETLLRPPVPKIWPEDQSKITSGN